MRHLPPKQMSREEENEDPGAKSFETASSRAVSIVVMDRALATASARLEAVLLSTGNLCPKVDGVFKDTRAAK